MSLAASRPAAGRYYPALTGFRMVAASLIFIGHHAYALPAGTPQLLRDLVLTSYVGVSLFFVLSGYLIAHQYFHQSFHSPGTWLRYLAVRAARIFPLYWLVLYGLYLRWLFSVPELLLHLSLLKGYFIRYQLAGIVQAWTLTVELSFYLLAPLLFYLIRIWSLTWTWALCLFVGLLGAAGAWLLTAGPETRLLAVFHNMAWFTFFGRATEFFAGIYLFEVLSGRQRGPWQGIKRLPSTYTGCGLFLAGCLVLALLSGSGQPAVNFWPGLLVHNLLLPGSIILILYGLVTEKTWLQRLLSSPVAEALGHASYLFYLIHLGWIRNWLVNQVSTSVVLLFGIFWLLSLAGHYLLERPVYFWLKSKIRKA
ncbi:MAG: acyltransferase family protein [Adhaeribacter sp.]